MKNILFPITIICFLVGLVPLTAQFDNIDLPTAADSRLYGYGVSEQLIAGDLAMRSGRWDEAIMAFDNVVLQWPYWAPAYVKRAMAKLRMGRTKEAREDLQFAQRISENSVTLFSENRHADRLELLVTTIYNDNPQDDTLLNKLITFKRNGQIGEATKELEMLWSSGHIDAADFALLNGNLSLLAKDYYTAIRYYDQALVYSSDLTIHHNRGLAQILRYNFSEGCNDLIKAGQEGHQPALDQWSELCTF